MNLKKSGSKTFLPEEIHGHLLVFYTRTRGAEGKHFLQGMILEELLNG